MNSINQQQPEQNRKDLHGPEAIEKIKDLANKAQTCFFCTQVEEEGLAEEGLFTTRPMSVQKIDDEGNLWFLIAEDSHTNAAVNKNPNVQLLFQGSHHSDFLAIHGKTTTTKDKAIIKELWEPIVKTWFTEGVDDPRITVLKVTPQNGYYWDTKHGTALAFAKQIAGAISGKTMDDSIEGSIHP